VEVGVVGGREGLEPLVLPIAEPEPSVPLLLVLMSSSSMRER